MRAFIRGFLPAWLFVIATGHVSLPPAFAQASGVKEVVIDSQADFKHTTASPIKLWKANDRVQVLGGDPVGYFMGNADLSDPSLILTTELETLIAKITTQQQPTPNTCPAEPGELRLAGWDSKTPITTVGRDSWNDWTTSVVSLSGPSWATPPAARTSGPSLPVGGLNYILQSFKVYRTGLLDRLRLKLRCHPGVLRSEAPDLYVTILANDTAGTIQPKTYASGAVMKEAVLGSAVLKGGKLAADSLGDGTTPFQNIEIVFRGVERPMLVADKLYWMKISTLPCSR